MMTLMLAAALISVHLETSPPAQAKVQLHAACTDGRSTDLVVSTGVATQLSPPCADASLLLSLPGYEEQTVLLKPGQTEVMATLLKLAKVSGPLAESVTVVWRRVGETKIRQGALSKESPEVLIPPGTGCLGWLRDGKAPRLHAENVSPGQQMFPPAESWAPGVRLEGLVLDTEQLGLDARVQAVDDTTPAKPGAKDPCNGILDELAVTRATTSREGAFSIGPVSTGRWRMTASSEGHSSVERTVVVSGDKPSLRLDPFLLRPVASLSVSLDPGASGLNPPFDLSLEIELRGVIRLSERWHFERRVEIGESLTVSFEDLAPGLYRLALSKAESDLSFWQMLELRQGEHRDLTLRPAPYFLEGRVTEGDKAVSGARVRLFRAGMKSEATTDTKGDYSMRLWVAEDFAGGVEREGSSAPYPFHLNLKSAKPGEHVIHDIALPASHVSGRVVALESGDPISGASVLKDERHTKDDLRSNLNVTTGADGRFDFAFVEPEAEVSLEARADGYLPERIEVGSGAAREREIVVSLRKGDTVKGRVVGPAGEPIAGATVACCNVTVIGPMGVQTISEPDGSFVLTAPKGSRLWAVARGYGLGWGQASAESADLVLGPSNPPQTVRVIDGANKPVPGVTLTFSTESGDLVPLRLLSMHNILSGGTMVTGRDGVATPTGLPAGTVTVWLVTGTAIMPLGVVTVPSSVEQTLRAASPK
jgi:hypothetical protein